MRAYRIACEQQPNLVLFDIPPVRRAASLLVLEMLRGGVTAHIPVLVSSTNTALLQQRAPMLRIRQYPLLEKPFDFPQLLDTIAQATSQAPMLERHA